MLFRSTSQSLRTARSSRHESRSLRRRTPTRRAGMRRLDRVDVHDRSDGTVASTVSDLERVAVANIPSPGRSDSSDSSSPSSPSQGMDESSSMRAVGGLGRRSSDSYTRRQPLLGGALGDDACDREVGGNGWLPQSHVGRDGRPGFRQRRGGLGRPERRVPAGCILQVGAFLYSCPLALVLYLHSPPHRYPHYLFYPCLHYGFCDYVFHRPHVLRNPRPLRPR